MRILGIGLLLTALLGGMGCVTTADNETGWISLFDGTTLSGWEMLDGFDEFTVSDGAIVGTGDGQSGGVLVYSGNVQGASFKDFELRAEVYVSAESNSGIIFHADRYDPYTSSIEAQINNSEENEKKTGSLFAGGTESVVVSENQVPPGTWFTYHILVRGKLVELSINGKRVAEYIEQPADNFLTGGALCFQAPMGTVKFKSIMIKPM
jgi:hypothetical protein